MARRNTLEDFIELSSKIHNNKYDYSKVVYVNNKAKFTIICPNHGEFLISSSSYICMKYGCIECGGTRRRTTEEFINRSQKIHNNKYDYSKVRYINTRTPVIIICKQHGEFLQTPFSHNHSLGCPKCGINQRSITKVKLGKIPPSALNSTEYKEYIKDVRRFTNRSYKKYKNYINPLDLRLSHRNGHRIDHIYSKRAGFEHNVPPEIIGHWTNLRVIPDIHNITKNVKCDKTLEQLYADYKGKTQL